MHLKIDGVGFSYSSSPVLEDVSVELDGPSFVSILGPNGVGKSTLIHCINRILTPGKGTVFIDGLDVRSVPIKELARIVGYVPYSASDTFPLSVVDTVLMGRHPHSRWGSQDHDLGVVYETLDDLGIADLAMRPFNELSAGQHQKVMLARGLVQEPRVLLLDEPTSNLDVRHQLDVAKLLKRLSVERGMLVVMICHDINIAAKYSDTILMMSAGRVYAMGTPEEVVTVGNLRDVYGVETEIVSDGDRPHVILKDSVRTRPAPFQVGIAGILAEDVGGSRRPLVDPIAVPIGIRSDPGCAWSTLSPARECHCRRSRGSSRSCAAMAFYSEKATIGAGAG